MDGVLTTDISAWEANAGSELGFQAAVVYIMTDWGAVASALGLPTWSHARSPCPLCNCSSESMHSYRMIFFLFSFGGGREIKREEA
eukprot:8455855-Pyramimonas_sp.AAC.1